MGLQIGSDYILNQLFDRNIIRFGICGYSTKLNWIKNIGHFKKLLKLSRADSYLRCLILPKWGN